MKALKALSYPRRKPASPHLSQNIIKPNISLDSSPEEGGQGGRGCVSLLLQGPVWDFLEGSSGPVVFLSPPTVEKLDHEAL